MQKELADEGRDVAFLAINANGDPYGDELAAETSFPIFQDVTKVMAWKRYGGYQDDMFIYDADGMLVTYLPYGGPIPTDLSDTDDYEAVKREIIAAMDATTP